MLARDEPNKTQIWPATLPPTSQQRWSVFSVAALLVIAFGALAPFASTQVQRFDPFIPLMLPTISITNLITSILLYAYLYIYRSAALLVLASGYLFTALIVIANALTIPGVFAPTGLLGAGLQTSAWLYCIWHTAFPAVLLIYAWLKEGERGQQVMNASAGLSVGAAIAIIFGLACGLTLLAIQGEDFLPKLLLDRTNFASTVTYVLTFMLGFCAMVLSVLWVRRRSVLDYWLMIVTLSLIAEIALSLFGGGRTSLGSYANRIFSLVTSTIILVLLVAEMTRAHSQLASSNAMLQTERNNKLMNLEAMVASIAHEVRQPLAAIALNGSAALRFLGWTSPNLEEVRSNLNVIVAEGHRASQVFDNILALFRRGDTGHEPVDMNEIISEVLRILGGQMKDRGITIRADLMPEGALVIGHRGQLQEVLLNLVRNAVEAMDAVREGSRVLQVKTNRHESDQIVVAVEDSGPGIDPKKIDGIFDAFVSTKPQGMGLGLAICRMIIERHGGQLSAWSAKKRGAVFQFTLPTGKA